MLETAALYDRSRITLDKELAIVLLIAVWICYLHIMSLFVTVNWNTIIKQIEDGNAD